ncbi:helix-turn-helix domain-containing protein [Thiospirochaeta perfilievii]|uniref:Helix-turn-helix domain-containing protein n=1 Tax=Thiospirochaeta perfilievii TaxID=252967 RepID=A0A5C1QCE1_9SPIO|nr:helix-turn-helix domain-containing protein [Thiospirochaeta perfilievii]QEN04326.1 helix-turn-helix domain-containing protein [Thiospirochaeta perfilievii]
MTTNKDFRFITDNKSLSLGYKKWIKGSQNRHLHDGYEILYVVNGSRDMFVGNQTFKMEAGDLLFIPPNILHKSFNNHKGSEIYSLHLYRNYNHNLEEPFILKSNRVINLIIRIRDEFVRKQSGYQDLVEAFALEIFIYIVRNRFNNIDSIIDNIDGQNSKIMSIVNYININFTMDLSLSNISEKFDISNEHLSRSFSKNTGFSIIDYINHVRIQYAKKMLLNKKLSIVDICYKSGFGSVTNFGRVFKKLNGLTPRDYRKTL